MVKKPIRILHVLSIMDRGGAETFVMNIYRKTRRDIIQFDFVVHSSSLGAFDAEIHRLGGKIYSCPAFKGINYIQYTKWWNRFLDEHTEYRVIHSHIRSTASLILGISKLKSRYSISHSHSISNGKNFSSIVKYLLQLPIRFIADSMIACSDEAGKWLFGKSAVKSSKFQVWKNGIDVQMFRYSEERRKLTRILLGLCDNFVVGHVGRFSKEKNHKFLLEVFKAYHDTNPKSLLLLVGDGSLIGKTKMLANELGISGCVHFLGVRKDIPALLDAMDCFLFPSLFEGLGISAIEAQTSGLPCLISDRVPQSVKISENTKFISIRKGTKLWVECLGSLLTTERQRAYESTIGHGYDIIKIVQNAEKFYIDVHATNALQ